jgi:poly(hydroxyalkanoate) depolymerase family esterase
MMTLILSLLFSFSAHAELSEVNSFGPNPGRLGMYVFSPSKPLAKAPVVVLLHGCAQTARDFDDETGWTKYAELGGFYLVLAEQSRGNNAMSCFNWFEPGDIRRGSGEVESIVQMIEAMKRAYRIDSDRIFVTGLSAGGAMAAAALANYPEVFKGGALVAGIPFGCGRDISSAILCMNGLGAQRSAQELGDYVRRSSNHSGRWPMVSIWQGGADTAVNPSNAQDLVKQWSNLHEIDARPALFEEEANYTRSVYANADGDDVIEYIVVKGQGHGQAIDPGPALEQCGRPIPYVVDAGVCASYHISKFWGLIE